jgi:hypothetical protein
MIKEYIIPKVDGNKSNSENPVIHNLQTLPFSSFDALMDLAMNGYVKKEQLNNYLDIKQEYQHLVGFKIVFYDLVIPETEEQNVKTTCAGHGACHEHDGVRVMRRRRR